MRKETKWITGKSPVDADSRVSPYRFRKTIKLCGKVKQATLTSTALGIYRFRMDGALTEGRYFAPGYTEYFLRLQEQTADVTAMLLGKDHVLAEAELADGWYTGRLGLSIRENRYGNKRALRAELAITYEDGTIELVGTDETWQVTDKGPRQNAGFFDGEVYDARKEEIPEELWEAACIYAGTVPPEIVADSGTGVIRRECIKPVDIFPSADGETLVDFGKNMAGIVEIGPFDGKDGQRIVIRHGELVQNGCLYTGNLRTAKQTLDYTAKEGLQTWAPEFTFMGFRYISVKGYEVTRENIRAYVLCSNMEEVGSFACSDERLNTLARNIRTSLMANFVDIPTDCPQRDERCGWTGDIAVFAPTAAYLMDIEGFMKKWLADLWAVQREAGTVPTTVPSGGMLRERTSNGWAEHYGEDDAVWGDAAVRVPWAVYMSTGDISILEGQYESMKAWVEYERAHAGKPCPTYSEEQTAKYSILARWNEYEKKLAKPEYADAGRYIWREGFHLGDWLAPGEDSVEWAAKAPWTSTAYFADSAAIVARAARTLGREEDAAEYEALADAVRSAFRKAFVGEDDRITDGFQSAWALALRFGLLTPEQEKQAVSDLAADVRARGNHLGTGFAGTSELLFSLSDHGCPDTAWDLMMQDTCPSWLYPVRCGAASTWERWDSLMPDGSVNPSEDGPQGMVSFNHYAYGAVGNWMFGRIGGIEPLEPGYRLFRAAPMPGGGLTWAETSHKTPFGWIRCRWDAISGTDDITMKLTVPEGTRAVIPGKNGEETLEAGNYTIRIAR